MAFTVTANQSTSFSITLGAGSTGQIKVYDGSAWTAKPVKVWDGSAWVVKPVKRWDGSAWVETTY
jgi:hypothetical protein